MKSSDPNRFGISSMESLSLRRALGGGPAGIVFRIGCSLLLNLATHVTDIVPQPLNGEVAMMDPIAQCHNKPVQERKATENLPFGGEPTSRNVLFLSIDLLTLQSLTHIVP
jgi:hypothetical protein